MKLASTVSAPTGLAASSAASSSFVTGMSGRCCMLLSTDRGFGTGLSIDSVLQKLMYSCKVREGKCLGVVEVFVDRRVPWSIFVFGAGLLKGAGGALKRGSLSFKFVHLYRTGKSCTELGSCTLSSEKICRICIVPSVSKLADGSSIPYCYNWRRRETGESRSAPSTSVTVSSKSMFGTLRWIFV